MQKIALCNPDAVVFDDPAVLPYAQSVRISPPAFGFVTKMLLVMKLTIVLLVFGLMNTYASGYSQTITFSGKNVPLARVFSVIEKQTGFNIFTNKELLLKAKPVSVDAVNMPLADFLNLAFNDQPISYVINNNTIFIKEKPGVAPGRSVDQDLLPEDLQREINGTVLNIDKEPLEGATITIKGTGISTTTKADGTFALNAEPGQILIVSYIGYQTQEVRVRNRNAIQIILQKEVKEIEEVVVTAMGIKRKVKALTYNVQEIKGEELNAVSDGSLVSGLAGKIAGATINSSSAGTGSSSRIILRGLKSLDGNNNALYVIDGIPMTNTIRTQAEDIYSGAGQSGDFVANLNPDDVESISVLSGPAAAALYGSAAANGVIVINTKKGQTGRTAVGITNNTTFSSPFVLPRFQNTYGVSEIGSYYSWGDKLTTPSTYKPTDFFQTGVNTNNSLSFSTGTEKNQTYLSLGNVISNGIIPNNRFGRSNLTARNTSTFFNDKLNLDISFMTGIVDERNMISQGQYFNPLVAVYLFPPGEDFNKVRAFERYDVTRNLLTQSWVYGDNGLMMQNPYWVTQRDVFKNKKERYLTTLSLKYNMADWISISGRVRLDKGDEKAEKQFAASTNKLFASDNGFYALNTLATRQIYAEGLVSINKDLSKDYQLIANVGAAIDDVRFDQYLNSGKLGYVANMYSFGNIDKSTAEMKQTGYVRQKQSVFGTVQLGFRNMVFLDITSRNDWASTLIKTTSPGFFYPSVGLSAIVTDLYNIRSKALTFLKIRGSYSEVGNEPKEFLTILYSEVEGNYPGEIKRMFNPDLKAELTKSYELGMNAMLFNGKFKLDATLYSTRTYNQFFEPIISVASGSKTVVVNGGRVDNKGIELSARYTAGIGRVNWTSFVNYSLNKNKIVRMLENWKSPVDGKIGNLDTLDMFGTGSYKMVNMKGGSMGDIYVNTLKVDEHGAIYVDPGSQTVLPEPNKFVYAGNNNPKYTISWGNNISWNGISLGFMFNARVGGIVVSNTKAIMDAFGVSKSSADARDAGGAMVNGRPVPAKEYYSVVGAGASGGIASMYTFSATNVRLGEVTLGYDLPVRKIAGFIRSANVSFIARNLIMLYNTAPFDPELTANTQTYFQGIDYFMMPSLRSLGFSVKLNF